MINKGLDDKQVLELRKKFGENAISFKEKAVWLSLLFSQFKSPLIYILLAVGLASLVLKEYFDAGLISFVVIANILMGFFQEFSAKKTLLALKSILKPEAIVIRNGQRKKIEIKELVPGDLVILGSGDKIPADGKIIEGVSLLVSEAILTGEEEAVTKNANDGYNLLFMGTAVISGRGIMEITKIGAATKMGEIGKSLAEIKETKTPIQIKLEGFAKNLAVIILLICLFVLILGVIHKENLLETIKIAVILSIAAIPEALSIAITIILTTGMRRILKKNGLVKTLLSIETLGSTSVICTDKTGTLTEGIMKVVKTDFLDRTKALLVLSLNNDRRSNLEVAVWDYAKNESGFNPQETVNQSQRIYEEPFDSEKKYSTTISRINNKDIALLMGAPEIIIQFCQISAQDKISITEKIEKWASEGLRILALASKETGDLKNKKDFSWLGIVGVADPIRKEAAEAILVAQKAGIKVKIVTGDYRKTAEKIAENLGLRLEPRNIMESQELEVISEIEFKQRIDDIILFTRVTPHQKQKIVKALQEKGEIVAMTGDGVNDAPALKKANIGIAVGNASDVAKEASDLILLDSNFKTIIDVIEEGRLVFNNIKKTVGYVLSNSFAEIALIIGAIVLNFPAPLTVALILWIHLICDGPLDLSLAFESKDKTLMQAKPQDIQKEKILSGLTKSLIAVVSLTVGSLSLLLFWNFGIKNNDLAMGRTLAFATIATASLVYIFAYKNLDQPIIKTKNFFQNKFMFLGSAYGLILVFLAIYLPALNNILKTTPLKPFHWLMVFGVASLITIIIELVKFFFKLSPGKLKELNTPT